MIDTRFPPKPTALTLSLYKNVERENVEYQSGLLAKKIAAHYGVHISSVFLSSSATMSFLQVIKLIFNRKILIGIPKFFCPDFAFSCVAAGHQLLLYELTPTLTFDEDALYFLKSNSCDLIIWPSFFGARPYNKEMVEAIVDSNIYLVLDEAQSFPIIQRSPLYTKYILSLISFGKNKPLSYQCGGAIISHGENITTNTETITIQKPCGINKIYSDLKCLLLDRYNEKAELVPVMSKDLDVIAESNCYSNWQKHAKRFEERKFFWSQMKKSLPSYVLLFIRDCQEFPSILALSVDNRFSLAAKFSKLGIQTTWYYYPLDLIPLFSRFPSQPLRTSQDISKRILIFPWSLHHSSAENELLYQEFQNVFN